MAADVAYAVGATLKVDGSELDDALAAHVEQLVVDEDLQRPTMFAITLLDPTRDILKRTGMRHGAEVEVAVIGQGASDDKPLVKGDVVTVECEYDELGTRVVVRGFAASHRLHRGPRTRVFRNVTDSDIVKQIAQEAGIDVGEIQATSEVHDQVSQANLTDWDFLAARARPLGFDLTFREGSLHFGARNGSSVAPAEADANADPMGLDPRQLIYGYNLLGFHGRISAAEQVGEVEVRGWDADGKELVSARVKAATIAAKLPTADPTKLAGVFGAPTFVEVTGPIRTDREAENVAKAIAERIGSGFAEAEGTAIGNSALRAGVAVRVGRVNEDFAGSYVLSHVRHVFDAVGYRTHFTISGQHDRSLLGLASAGPSRPATFGPPATPRAAGVVVGIVTDNADPKKAGRVKVRYPWLNDGHESDWTRVTQYETAANSGAFFIPEAGDEVLVAFEHGDIERPYVIGSLYNGVDKPFEPLANPFDHGKVMARGYTSRERHELAFFDARGGSGPSGVLLRTGDNKQSVVLNAKDGEVDITGDPNVVIEAFKELDATSRGDMTIKVQGKLTIDAQGGVAIKSAGVVDIDGAQIQLN